MYTSHKIALNLLMPVRCVLHLCILRVLQAAALLGLNDDAAHSEEDSDEE